MKISEILTKDCVCVSLEATDKVGAITELVDLLDVLFLSRTSGEWEESLQGNDDIIWERVQRNLDLPKDPQVVANDYIVELDHPQVGLRKQVGIAVKMSATPGAVRSTAPEYGQHTEEVLLAAGFTWDEIVALRDGGVIV